MTQTQVSEVGDQIAKAAMLGAVEYILANGGMEAFDIEKVVTGIKAGARVAIDEGMRDAKEALDCGMTQIATTALLASMRLCGINAAKAAKKGE